VGVNRNWMDAVSRRPRKLTFEGETLTIAQWAKKKNLSVSCIHCRLLYEWPIEKALNTPARQKTKAWKSKEIREHLKRMREELEPL